MPYRPKLFADIELDERVRASCARVSARLQAQGLDARFEPPEKFHITVAFLGWTDTERVESIQEALAAAANAVRPFTLTLDTLGAFPHERRPRVVWIGARDQGAPYRALAYAAQAAFETLGFSFGKDAVAHVTLARVKGGRAHLPVLDIKPMHLHVTKITLFESIAAGHTTRYEVRKHAALNANA